MNEPELIAMNASLQKRLAVTQHDIDWLQGMLNTCVESRGQWRERVSVLREALAEISRAVEGLYSEVNEYGNRHLPAYLTPAAGRIGLIHREAAAALAATAPKEGE